MVNKIKFIIEPHILNNYVDTINSIKEPMYKIKRQLNKILGIKVMIDTINDFSINYPNEKTRICIDTIKQIMDTNNGMLSTRMIEPLNISRQYLSIMEKNNMIEKVSRGIYISTNVFEDSYYCFQQKYKKVIFSHMNALYFYDMTEEFPYNYTVSVPQGYHDDTVNNKCNAFYVSDDIYEMGVIEINTPSGNKVRVYDKERCICDIIRSIKRMDFEQVEKVIKKYIHSSDVNMGKISEYANKIGISDKVMEMIGIYI